MSALRPGFALALLVAATAPRSGCVVRYGPPPEPAVRAADPLPPPVDFDEVVSRVDSLLADPVDIDQRDRLLAAATLARKARTDDAATQRVVLAYLREVVAIEERARPVEAPVLQALPQVEGFTPVEAEAVTEETLDASLSVAADRFSAALACRDQPCFAEYEADWPTLLDAHVAAVREDAGARYLAARQLPDPSERLAEYRALRATLADLADRFPGASAADDVRRNVALVQREIESLLAAQAEAPATGAPTPESPAPEAPASLQPAPAPEPSPAPDAAREEGEVPAQ